MYIYSHHIERKMNQPLAILNFPPTNHPDASNIHSINTKDYNEEKKVIQFKINITHQVNFESTTIIGRSVLFQCTSIFSSSCVR
jgi:hypothetical protein